MGPRRTPYPLLPLGVRFCGALLLLLFLCCVKFRGRQAAAEKNAAGASRTPKVSQSLECCQLPVIIDDVVLATSARGMAPPHPVELTESPYWNRSYGVFAGTHALLERLKPLR